MNFKLWWNSESWKNSKNISEKIRSLKKFIANFIKILEHEKTNKKYSRKDFYITW